MSKLGKAGAKRKSKRKARRKVESSRAGRKKIYYAAGATAALVVVLLFLLAVAAGAYLFIFKDSDPAPVDVPPTFELVSAEPAGEAPVVLTLSEETTSSVSAMMGAQATESTLYTTSTIACGGDGELQCETDKGLACNIGFILGSGNVCRPKECAPSVASGKEGCGAWALNYCR